MVIKVKRPSRECEVHQGPGSRAFQPCSHDVYDCKIKRQIDENADESSAKQRVKDTYQTNQQRPETAGIRIAGLMGSTESRAEPYVKACGWC